MAAHLLTPRATGLLISFTANVGRRHLQTKAHAHAASAAMSLDNHHHHHPSHQPSHQPRLTLQDANINYKPASITQPPLAAGKHMCRQLTLTANDGRPLAAYHFTPAVGQPRASIVVGPAIAVTQAFYRDFAAHLASQGFSVWTFDYRGLGESHKGSLRGVKASLSDWLLLDYDAAIKQAASHSGLPVYLIGHSLGGQGAPLLPSANKVAGLINVAVGSGSIHHYAPRLRRKAPLIWNVAAPLLCPLFGYFPGSLLGVVGDVPTDAMMQLKRWCMSPDYLLSAEPGAREAYHRTTFPVLALTFNDDAVVSEAGSRLLHAEYGRQPVDYRVIHPAAHNIKRIGHSGFFRPQSRLALWPMVTDWIDAQLGATTRKIPIPREEAKAEAEARTAVSFAACQ
eukprot:m.211492 g.211492  ORF g.211492 m.211492 type:complete len:397 (-) comp18394_c0_seq1:220-1410(-)